MIQKFYEAIINKDKEAEEKLYFKLLEKSLRGKNTVSIK